MIKILAGAEQRDEGEIWLDGQAYDQYSPHDAIQMGISVIYQEFNLVRKLSIEENIFLGKEYRNGIFTDKKAMIQKAREVFEPLGGEIDPRVKVAELSVAYQQLVEIAKAVINRAKIIVMDEPSAALSLRELEILFKLIRRLKSEGTSIIYISHRLEEVFEIADRVSVFRDGKYVGTRLVSETNKDQLISMMVGRELSGDYPQNEQKRDRGRLEGCGHHQPRSCATCRLSCIAMRSWASPGWWAPGAPSCCAPFSAPIPVSEKSTSTAKKRASALPRTPSAMASPSCPKTARPMVFCSRCPCAST